MKSIFKIFTIILMIVLMTGSIFAVEKFSNFPNMGETSGDILLGKSALGDEYVKISSTLEAADSYVLLYKIYDVYGSFKKIKQQENSFSSSFNIKIDKLKSYEFVIIAIQHNSISKITPIEVLSRGERLERKIVSISHETKALNKSKSKAKYQKVYPNGLELTLDIDKQSFPYINLLVKITKDGKNYDGTELSVLDRDNFSISEDNRLQSNLKIIPPQANSTKKIADIVFVHDDSGSLDDEASQVKANIQAFLNKLAQSGIDYRVGLVPYGGGGRYSDPSGTIKHNGNLHDNGADLISDLNNMRFDGGTERAFDAMNLASNSINWRQSTQKIIILVTDEDNDNGSINESTVTTNLKNNEITVYGLTRGHSEFNRIATATGGKIYSITSNFSDILDEIGTEIISKYIVRYKTDNLALNGLERTVGMDVKIDDGQGGLIEGSIEDKYIPTPPIEIITEVKTNDLSNKGQREYVSLPIYAKITKAGANSNQISAKLHYKSTNSGVFTSIDMDHLGDGLFSADIPNDAMVRPKVEYYISATDGDNTYTYPSNDAGIHPIVISVLPNIAPEISSIYISKAEVGNDLIIKAKVEDVTNEVVKVTLYYREQGSASYKTIESLFNKSKVDFEATIPLTDVTEHGIEYYIEAVDDFDVYSTYGSSTNPIKVSVTYSLTHKELKKVGLVTVYANQFTDKGNNIWEASGNVVVSRLNGSKILRFSSSLQIDENTQKITSLSEGDITALSVRTSKSELKDILLYTGSFTIDYDNSKANPIMKLTKGVSKLRPNYNGPLVQYLENSTIEIKDSEIEFSDAYTELTSLEIVGQIGKLTLSQTETSKQPIIFDFGDPLKFVSIRNSNFELGGLKAQWDWMDETFEVGGSLNLNSIFKLSGGKANSISGVLGFAYNPFELNTFGVGVGLSDVTSAATRFPPLPSPIGVQLTGLSAKIDGIASNRNLILSGQADMALRDAGNILGNIKKIISYDPITGNIILVVDMSGKLTLSGEIKLLEKITLANARLTIGNPSLLDANLDLNVLKGRLYLSAGTDNAQKNFEMMGQEYLSFFIPGKAPWIGGTKLGGVSSYVIFSFGNSKINKLEASTSYDLFWTEIGIRVTLDDGKPHLYLKGFGSEEKQIFKANRKFSKLSKVTNDIISINKSTPYVFIKVISTNENSSADFNLTLPDGTKFTPDTALADKNSPNIDKIFFMSNANAKEAYYAIKNPENGSYKLDINNKSELGGYTVSVIYPNDKPKIILDDGTDEVWDGSSAINISWKDSDKDNDAKISLYYSTENSGHRGTPIAIDISEDDVVDNYDWTPSEDIQSGDYYIFAKIDDGEYAPTFVYRAGKITINNSKAPEAPKNIVITPIDGGLQVKWDSISGSELSYRIYVSENGVDKVYDFASGTDNEYIVHGLKNNTLYNVQVQTINKEGYSSVLSNPVSAQTPFNANNPGGAPDLTIDTTKSSVISRDNKIDGDIKIKVFVENIGDIDAAFAKVKCYYGNMDSASLLDTKTLGTLEKDKNITVEFDFNTQSLGKNDSRMFYIIIEDVISDELITTNNMVVLKSELSKNEDINNDFEVNILDYMKVQVVIDSDSLDLNADTNNDGVIDTDDLNLIKLLWGKKY